ncbi:MAG: ABC transporter substrate-binding protein [Burkholderiaceae bacterium]
MRGQRQSSSGAASAGTEILDTGRRLFVGGAAAGGASLVLPRATLAQSLPGVSANELRIGNTTSLSGPVSALGAMARAQAAYFKMINEQGGVGGRKINFLFYDDGFNPAKTVEMTRKLVEQDDVALMFANLGTGPNSAIVKYVNQRGVPHLFLSVNGDKWADYKTFPWSMPYAPSGRVECQVSIKHVLKDKPDATFAILYQNDDFGRDYPAGARDVLGPRYDKQVRAASYEVTDPTLDSVLIQLLSSPADVLISGVTGKFGAMAIRKAYDLGFKGMHFIATGVSSVQSVLLPAGAERSTGVLSTSYSKDVGDPGLASDPGVKEYREFMTKWMPEGDPNEALHAYGYMTAMVMMQVLEQCNGDFSRKQIMAQANNLRDLENPILLPGIKVNTSPTDHRPLKQMQLQRFDGKQWVKFGPIIEGGGTA